MTEDNEFINRMMKVLTGTKIPDEAAIKRIEHDLPDENETLSAEDLTRYRRDLMNLIVFYGGQKDKEHEQLYRKKLSRTITDYENLEPTAETLGMLLMIDPIATAVPPEEQFRHIPATVRLMAEHLNPDDPMFKQVFSGLVILAVHKPGANDEKSRLCFQTALDVLWQFQDRLGPEHPGLIPLILTLAVVHSDLEAFPLARIYFEWAKTLATGPLAEDEARLAETLRAQVEYYLAQENPSRAQETFSLACTKMEGAKGKDDLTTLTYWTDLAEDYLEDGQYSKSLSILTRTTANLDRIQKNGPQFVRLLADALGLLVEVYEKMKKDDLAGATEARLQKIYGLYPDLVKGRQEEAEPSSTAESL